jgi:8-amino-3,8-dideoxy-alpha-D-manno-octulosonate transaminase
MPVHMRGVTSNMDALLAIARRRGVRVVEDVAQAIGGSYKGTKLGALGDAGAFSFQYNKLITAGEGGMVTTSDPEIFGRVLMYHDVLGGIRNGVPRADLLPGMNLRMPELSGAVLLAQLARLDGILDAIRTRYRALEEGIIAVFGQAGATMRPSHDRDGDIGLAMMFQMPDSNRAGWVVDALLAERVEAELLYSPDAFDFHVYPQWNSILSKRSWTPEGGPWRWSAPVEYSADMCPRTLDILARTVHISVNPMLEVDEIDETARAVRKVLRAVPTRFA